MQGKLVSSRDKNTLQRRKHIGEVDKDTEQMSELLTRFRVFSQCTSEFRFYAQGISYYVVSRGLRTIEYEL